MARGGGKADALQRKRDKDAARKRATRRATRVARAAELLRSEGIAPPPLRPEAANPFDSSDVPPDVPVMETVPVDGPGADAFAPEAAPSTTDAPPSEPERPLVEPPPPPPPPPPEVVPPRPVPTDAEVLPIAFLVSAFFQGGANALLRKRPDVRTSIAEAISSTMGADVPPDPMVHVPAVAGFVRGATVEVCRRWNIRFKYMYELVVAGAVGVGAFGFIVKPEPGVVAAPPARPAVASAPPPPPPPPPPERASSTTEGLPPIPSSPEVVS